MEDCHELLLDLAGRLPDDVLHRCRGLLVEHRLPEIGQAVAEAASIHDVGLDTEEIDLLRQYGVAASVLDQIDKPSLDDPFPFMFLADNPDDPELEEDRRTLDETMVRVAMADPGTRGLWRVWRLSDPDSDFWPDYKVLFVAETAGDPVSLGAALSAAMVALGEEEPGVEAYQVGADLPYYQRSARISGQLLWAPESNVEFRMARVYDEVDPNAGPRFREDHPVIEDADEIARIVGYLRAGEPLLVSTVRMDDVVDPSRGAVVPMNFHTNGEWIWPDTVAYYLAEHKLEPELDLLSAIRDSGYAHPDLDSVLLQKAFDHLWNPPIRD